MTNNLPARSEQGPVDPMIAAKTALTIAIRELPQSDTVAQMPWGDGLTDAEYVSFAAEFLGQYATRVKQIQGTAAGMSAELVELRAQRKAIRDFLGTGEQ